MHMIEMVVVMLVMLKLFFKQLSFDQARAALCT